MLSFSIYDIIIIIIIVCFLNAQGTLLPKAKKLMQRDYNALCASRLVKKLGRQVPEWIAETDRVVIIIIIILSLYTVYVKFNVMLTNHF